MLDKAVSAIASVGVPGLVFLIVMGTSGLAGAAAMTFALSALGGPLGMAGGIAVLVGSPLVLWALSRYGWKKVAEMVIGKMVSEGRSKEAIWAEAQKMPISKGLKREVKALLFGE
jgi:hypothetical protein